MAINDQDFKLVKFRTGEVYQIGVYSIEEDGEYPHAWFKNNPNTKPQIQLSLKDVDYISALSAISTQDIKTIKPSLIKMVLHKFAVETKVLLEADWTSDGINIGKKGDEISISSLYNINTGDEEWEGHAQPSSAPKPDEEAIIGSLLLLYRISRIPNSPMLTEILDNLSDRFRAVHSTSPVFGLISARDHFSILDNDLNFRKLIASYDMFFTKFPKHPLAKLRIGTLPSRWRDCTAFKNVFETYNLLAMSNIVEYSAWIWEPAVHQDLDRLCKHPFGVRGVDHGYFYYASDFGFVNKSIYSVTQNPAIHLFNQVIHCAFGRPRGVNARMVHPPNAPLVVKNALYVSFALKTGTAWEVAYGSQQLGEEIKRLGLNDPLPSAEAGEFHDQIVMPDDRNPLAWFSYWQAVENNYTPEFLNFIRAIRSICKDHRTGTVGQFLYDHLAMY